MEPIHAWLLPKGINVEPQSVIVMVDYDDPEATAENIKQTVGAGTLGITPFLVTCDEDATLLFAMINHNEDQSQENLNLLACSLMHADEPIFGDMLVFGGIDQAAPDLEPDGRIFDVPEFVIELHDSVVAKAADTWNALVEKMNMLARAAEEGVLDFDRLERIIEDEDEQGLQDLSDTVQRALDVLDEAPIDVADQLMLDIQRMLEDLSDD